jgi:peroxiredoxin
LTVTEIQNETEGKVRAVQVIPSVDEAAVVELRATATKTPVVGLTVTEIQVELEGKVRAVQVIPSVDEAAAVEL